MPKRSPILFPQSSIAIIRSWLEGTQERLILRPLLVISSVILAAGSCDTIDHTFAELWNGSRDWARIDNREPCEGLPWICHAKMVCSLVCLRGSNCRR